MGVCIRLLAGGTAVGVASAPPVTLAERVLRGMVVGKLKGAAGILVCLTLLATGVGLIAHEEPERKAPDAGAVAQKPVATGRG